MQNRDLKTRVNRVSGPIFLDRNLGSQEVSNLWGARVVSVQPFSTPFLLL